MRAVVQRVARASVSADGETVGSIGRGLVVLLAVATDDGPDQAHVMAEKVVHLRVFDDEAGRLNRSVQDVGGSVLVISQFTLYGDTSRGRRPSFVRAARPEHAETLVERFVEGVRGRDVAVATGRFRAKMLVEIHNDGPVTIVLETDRPGAVGAITADRGE